MQPEILINLQKCPVFQEDGMGSRFPIGRDILCKKTEQFLIF
jgi:hypothetical protein